MNMKILDFNLCSSFSSPPPEVYISQGKKRYCGKLEDNIISRQVSMNDVLFFMLDQGALF